jgi:hypothetical protein
MRRRPRKLRQGHLPAAYVISASNALLKSSGLLLGGDLLYLANSQLNRWNVKRAIQDTVIVLRLHLP